MVVKTQFHNFFERPFARVLYLILMKRIYFKYVGDSPGCYQGQQDDFPSPFCALILHNPHEGGGYRKHDIVTWSTVIVKWSTNKL